MRTLDRNGMVILLAAAGVLALFLRAWGWMALVAGMGLLGGLLLWGFASTRRPKSVSQRPRGVRGALRTSNPDDPGVVGRSAAKRAKSDRSRLEATLAKARCHAADFQDTYAAQNCCLEIIRQVEKEDPLFAQACDLYLNMATPARFRSSDGRNAEGPIPVPPGGRRAPTSSKVIPFPRTSGHR